ncbi:MAG: ectonucleotide pyrophosphatase/phosphodiesterase [Thermomicrobiales bacterium]
MPDQTPRNTRSIVADDAKVDSKVNGQLQRKVLLIGLDGLRPDLIDADVMPNLSRLIDEGTLFPDHHAAYPTHTRANIATLATGCYPGRHGVVANVFRLDPAPEPAPGIIDTSKDEHLRALDTATNGQAVLTPTLGDILERHDQRVAVAATSSAGAGILWTRLQPYRVVNVNSYYDRPDLLSLREKLGPIPPAGTDYRLERQMYAARAVTDIFIPDEETTVVVLWLNEPDSSLHRFGLGAPETRQALEICDDVISYVLDAIERRGEQDRWNVILLSDHGHSTVLHHRTLGEYLDRASRELGLGTAGLTTASDYVYAGPDATPDQISRLSRWVQEQPWAGAVFGSGPFADLPGVLPLARLWAGQCSTREPALAVSPVWSDQPNDLGVPGTIAALTEQVALRSTHGSASPFELHPLLAMIGPNIPGAPPDQLAERRRRHHADDSRDPRLLEWDRNRRPGALGGLQFSIRRTG